MGIAVLTATVLASPAAAVIEGPCEGFFNGIPIDQIDTPAEARQRLRVTEDDVIAFTGTTEVEAGFVAVDLVFSPLSFELVNDPLDPEDRTYSGVARVGDHAKYGVGIYEVRGRTGVCSGNAFLILEGSVLSSLAGQLALAVLAAGILATTLGAVVPARRGRGRHLGRAIFWGLPIGIGAGVLVQQSGFWPLGAPLLGISIIIACIFTVLATMAAGPAAATAPAGAALPPPPAFQPPPPPASPPPAATSTSAAAPTTATGAKPAPAPAPAPAAPAPAPAAPTPAPAAPAAPAPAAPAPAAPATAPAAQAPAPAAPATAPAPAAPAPATPTAPASPSPAPTSATTAPASTPSPTSGTSAGAGSGTGTGAASGTGAGTGTGAASGAGTGAASGTSAGTGAASGTSAGTGAASGTSAGMGATTGTTAASGVAGGTNAGLLGLAATGGLGASLLAAAAARKKGGGEPEAYWFWVTGPTALYPLSGEQTVIGELGVDDWHLARATYEDWVHVEDPDGGPAGFVAADAVHRAQDA